MATTYTLKFEQFRVLDEYDDGSNIMADVIKDVHWRMHAITDDPTPVEAEVYGSVVLPNPTFGTFIPRGSVTVGNVQAWFAALPAEEGGGTLQDAVKGVLDAQIAKKQTPTDHVDNPDNTFTDGVAV